MCSVTSHEINTESKECICQKEGCSMYEGVFYLTVVGLFLFQQQPHCILPRCGVTQGTGSDGRSILHLELALHLNILLLPQSKHA